MTLNYKWSLMGSFGCCILVALLWGANLGAVYPFVEVVMRQKTLHDWVEERLDDSNTRIVEQQKQIDDLEKQIAAGGAEVSAEALRSEIVSIKSDISSEETKKEWTNALAPYIRAWAPSTPFATLGWLMAFMFIGTVIRGLFLMGNMLLAVSYTHLTLPTKA